MQIIILPELFPTSMTVTLLGGEGGSITFIPQITKSPTLSPSLLVQLLVINYFLKFIASHYVPFNIWVIMGSIRSSYRVPQLAFEPIYEFTNFLYFTLA